MAKHERKGNESTLIGVDQPCTQLSKTGGDEEGQSQEEPEMS